MDKELYELLADEIKACETTQGHCFIVRQEYKDYINDVLDDIRANHKFANINASNFDMNVETINEFLNEVSKEFIKRIKLEEHKEIYFNNRSYIVLESILWNYKDNENYQLIKKRIFSIYVIYRFIYIGLVQEKDNELKKTFKQRKLKSKDALDIDWIIQNQNELADIFNNLTEDTKKDDIKPLEKAIFKKNITLLTNRPNQMIWNKNYVDKKHKQPFKNGLPQELEIDVSKGLKNKDSSVLIVFKNIPKVFNLNKYDETVHNAILNLWLYGNSCVSLENIYYKMFLTKEMASSQKEELKESIRKMNELKIIIDNTQAFKTMKDYQLCYYEGPLLPGALTKRVYKGKLIDCYERAYMPGVYEILPLYDLAIKSNNEIITLPDEIYKIPFTSKSNEKYLALRYYLISNLFYKYKNKSKKKKIKNEDRKQWDEKTLLLATLFKNLGITKENLKHTGTLNRAKKDIIEKTKKFLKQWQTQGYISLYEITEEKIVIYY